MLEHIDLWPTRIYRAQILGPEDCQYYEQLIQELRPSPEPLSWTSRDTLDQDPKWSALTLRCLTAVEHVLEQERVNYDRVRMNCMWVNVHSQGGQHQQHHHPNSLWSGVVYLTAPEPDPGDFFFRDPRPAANSIIWDRLDHDQGDYYRIRPQLGWAIIFPSWLEHGVYAGTYQGQRISLSWNTWCEMRMQKHPTIRAEFR